MQQGGVCVHCRSSGLTDLHMLLALALSCKMMQVFFSKRCPLVQWDLPLLQKILYTNGGLSNEQAVSPCIGPARSLST
jgi:hypothetical protein